MTNEPPFTLKSNMRGSYKSEPLSDVSFFSESQSPDVFKKIAFGLTMFHAIILQRRSFGPLGWNLKYKFTVSDL
jgi:dynein heavy chain